MDELLKSAVLAATITSIVALIGFFVSAATAKRINEDKLKLDEQLAEKKLELDERLADQKAAAELSLAERRVELERHLSLAKRRAEVAEKILSNFFQVKRAFEVVRSPMIWAEEMVEEEGVAEDVVRNDGYSVIRRARQYEALFSEVEAARFTFGALFGQPATAPFDVLIRSYNQVINAARDLLRYRNQLDQPELEGHIRAMRRAAFSSVAFGENGEEIPDQIAANVRQAVAEIEAICRPALESDVAAEAAGREA